MEARLVRLAVLVVGPGSGGFAGDCHSDEGGIPLLRLV
jgi:hypothetical protein